MSFVCELLLLWSRSVLGGSRGRFVGEGGMPVCPTSYESSPRGVHCPASAETRAWLIYQRTRQDVSNMVSRAIVSQAIYHAREGGGGRASYNGVEWMPPV